MEEARKRDLSRRAMLRRLGAGAAIVWSSPILTSLPARGQANGSPRCTTCGQDACGVVSPPCGQNPETGTCLCATTVEGACACFQPICGVGNQCASTSECATGFACVNADCCGVQFCAALCGTDLTAQALADGRRWG